MHKRTFQNLTISSSVLSEMPQHLVFFQQKNLGSYGDAGCVITNNKSLFKQIKILANHGSKDRKKFSAEWY